LKNFTGGKRPSIWVYDKATDKIFQTNVKNVAVERGFYDLEMDEGVLTMEPSLANLETRTSGIVEALTREENLSNLDTPSRAILAVFLGVQFVRTKEHRLRFEHLGTLLAKALRESGAREEDVRKLVQEPKGAEGGKLAGIKALLDSRELAPHFLNKAWVLFETRREAPFYISDNPMTLHNEIDHGPYGNLGLAVKGIEIYLPISTTLCLGLLCPSIAEEFQKAYRNIQLLDESAPGLADRVMNRPQEARAFCEGLVNGTPIPMVEDNVTMLNSLQVMYSSRFVYCERDSFALVKRMISDNAKYREGLKPTVG
jgi:hypothetical protein